MSNDLTPSSSPASPTTSGSFWKRILPLLLLIITFLLVGKLTPLGEYMSIAFLKEAILESGFWGVFIYVGAFVLCAILNLPCSMFLVFAVLVFGYWEGAGITYIASLLAAMITFHFSRLISGNALSQIRNVRVRRLISQAERRPVRTLILLRTLVQLSPLVGYALALTGMKSRHYLIGNLIGILIPIAYLTLGVFLLKDQLGSLLGV